MAPKGLLRRATLYIDSPERRYREISALHGDDKYIVRIEEGTVKQINPFKGDKADCHEILCSSRQEAIAEAQKHIELGQQSGWYEYNRY
jgi:hypothetical protein